MFVQKQVAPKTTTPTNCQFLPVRCLCQKEQGHCVLGACANIGCDVASYTAVSKEKTSFALASIFGPGQDAIVRHTPHADFLGIRVVETGPCFAVMMLPYRAELVGDPSRGVVFGGVITTLIDHTSGLAVACALEELTAIATIDLRIDYLRAAEPGCDLWARSECYKRTKNVAFVRAFAWEKDPADPFATCLATFMLGANRAGSPFPGGSRRSEGETGD